MLGSLLALRLCGRPLDTVASSWTLDSKAFFIVTVVQQHLEASSEGKQTTIHDGCKQVCVRIKVKSSERVASRAEKYPGSQLWCS